MPLENTLRFAVKWALGTMQFASIVLFRSSLLGARHCNEALK
jgi:hypothetical protein